MNSGDYGGGYGSNYGSSSTSYSYSYVKRETSKEGTPLAVGATGLYNLGNTCFLNSIIQCLSNTSQLSQYFTLDGYSQDLNVTNPSGTKVLPKTILN